MIRILSILVVLSVILPLTAAERGFVPIRRAEGAYVALVIGNGGYPDAPLANPVNDATDVAAALRGFGFVVDLIPDADRIQMADGIARFRAQLPKAKAAVFYYAGHGVQVQGENWLLPIGRDSATQITDETQVSSRALNAEEVIQAMEQAKVPMNLVILDACRNNPFRGSGRGRVQGLAELRAPVGTLILYATAAGKVAADGNGRNSPFTSALLKHLMTPGLDIRLLPSEITNSVGEMTGGIQVPWQSASLKSGFCFIPPMSEHEKFAAERDRKTEELRQAEMLNRLGKLAEEARRSDAARQQILETERRRVEAELTASKLVVAEITIQLNADLVAARESESAALGAARARESVALQEKQLEIAALDEKIRALKTASPQPGALADADLNALVAVMNQRKARKAELQRMEEEASAKRAKAAADAAEQRRSEEEAATERRRKSEAEAEAKREAVASIERGKAAELTRLLFAEQKALADRLERDVAMYRALASNDDGVDLAPAAWAKICVLYKVGEVRQGDEGELRERVLPGSRAADNAFADGSGTALRNFAAQYPHHARSVEALQKGLLAPDWTIGTDGIGKWARLTVQGQIQLLRLIPVGSFRRDSDGSVRDVVIPQPFWLGDSEVTQDMWQAVTGTNPSHFRGGNLPVDQVSWNDCQSFFEKINLQVPGMRIGFPTEAQWEYACRAGSSGDFAGDLDAMAWYDKNSGGTSHPVKSKIANAFGLFDMHGNVLEFCADRRDPSWRIDRGGAWSNGPEYCRSSYRDKSKPDQRSKVLGFRIAIQTNP